MAIANGHHLVALEMLVAAEADVVAALLGRGGRAVAVHDAGVEQAALVQHEDGVGKDHIEAAGGEPTAKHSIDAAVVHFGSAALIVRNGQLLPRTTEIQASQDVVEYDVHRELRLGAALPLGQEGTDKFVELLGD